MRSTPGLLLIFFLFLIGGCSNQSGIEVEGQHAPIRYSNNYQPPLFNEKDRIQKIGAALEQADHFYQESAATNHLPGLAYGVVVDDSLLFFGGFGTINIETGTEVTEHSLFRIASMSKSFTAMAILKLRDDRKLSLSDPLYKYIPELEQLPYLQVPHTSLEYKTATKLVFRNH